ncbi:uncharacterized protein LOC110060616 [Orbicella faveolata]|uniref:uncharacterized protein LOC110060616 n=1 Tax=Orbicella faveolata TaxID=48498 RepID=UPI0009E1D8FA|nr:uncharacterized protein LOC110060616 [Orbicella faveolata]
MHFSPRKCKPLRSLCLMVAAASLVLLVAFQTMPNRKRDRRLDNHSLSNKTTTQNSSANFIAGARLHLIVQFPVLNVTNKPENSSVVLRQKEYIYCLRRNLNSPHVS